MILKLDGVKKDYIWGGTKLKQFWNKNSDKAIVAESWDVSVHHDGVSQVVDSDNLDFIGKKLSEICPDLPFLVKFIDAKDNLSVQVHPNDDFARQFEGENGKTELWYIVDCDEGAFLYIGFKEKITKQQLIDSVKNQTLESLLQKHFVKKGQSFFIPAGTVHAIGAGTTVCEIQQKSNVTYRLFDFNRVDQNGKPRSLHIEKATSVATLLPYKNVEQVLVSKNKKLLAKCPYFCVYECKNQLDICKNQDFVAITIIEGNGKVGEIPFQKGDSFLIAKNATDVVVKGDTTFLFVEVEK